MEHKFIVTDEYGDSLRAFHDRKSVEAFVKVRPECSIEEIPPTNIDDLLDMMS